VNAVPLILASASPRRAELLRTHGYRFETVPSNDPEEPREDLDPAGLTLHHARNKARAIAPLHPRHTVLGADTLVALDGACLGKPRDLDEAAEMLMRLSGRIHEVHTGVWLTREADGTETGFVETSRVRFFALTPDHIARYLAVAEPLDKAGAYAAQETREGVVERVEGSFSNVVGLPMERLALELAKFGISS
jgi:septum formation protein